MGGPIGTDLTDPEAYRGEDHLRAWRVSRQQHPIERLDSPAHGAYWSVTTHALGQQVLLDPERFASSGGMRINAAQAGVEAAANQMLVVSDGAAHDRLRTAHSGWFTARNTKLLEDSILNHLDELVARMVDGRPVEVVQGLADAAPSLLVGTMLGIEQKEADRLAELVRSNLEESSGDTAGTGAAAAAGAQIFSFFSRLARRRADGAGEDVVSLLLRPQPDGDLSPHEVLLNCDGLVNGGFGTSAHALSGAVLAFATHPEQWARLREDRSLLGSAVEEVLRWVSPAMHVMRTATCDTTLGDQRVAAGERVVVWIPSCNRDESVFKEADAFRIDRRPNPHLSLGAGPHYCIGASIGRMEVRVVLRVLLAHVETMALHGEPARSASVFLNGLERLWVTMTPATPERPE